MLSPEGTRNFAIVVLFLVAFAPWIPAVICFRRSRYTPSMEAIMFACALWARVVWRAQVRGRIVVPPDRGIVVVCNHTSAVDPWFTFLACDRLIRWMVAVEFNEHPALRWFFGRCGTISVHRGGVDTAATKQAIRMAESGEAVGLFPEGRINLTDELLIPGRPGAALVAIKARVNVVPCYVFDAPHNESVAGTFITPAKTRLVVGPTIDIAEYIAREDEDGVLQELTLHMLREIARLAGRSDFEPRIAGRKWKPGEDENGGTGI